MAIKSLSIRIDDEMLNKLHVLADYEGRSANSQILILIREAIERYEEKHGKIETNWKLNAPDFQVRFLFFKFNYSSSSVILGALRSRTIITDSAAQIRSITAKAAVSQPFVAEVLLNWELKMSSVYEVSLPSEV